MQIVEFIDQFKAVYSCHVQRVFKLSRTVANRRLAVIAKTKEIKRSRDHFTMNCLYFTEKPTRHKLLVAEFYTRLLSNGGQIREFKTEYSFGGLRADAFAIYQMNRLAYYFFLEIQISNAPLDFAKYDHLYQSGYPWPTFPRIIVVSDREFKNDSPLRFIRIDTEFREFGKIFR